MATIKDAWPKKSFPSGHPADGMTLQVDMGDGAWMTMPDPRSYNDGGLVYSLTWGDAETYRYVAAAVIESYDYLLSAEINQAEAFRRLRELRRVRSVALRIGIAPPASATEARSAETQSGSVHEGAVGKAETPVSTPKPTPTRV